MKIWLVVEADVESAEPIAVFSSEEKAKAFVEADKLKHPVNFVDGATLHLTDYYVYGEFELDAPNSV